MTRSLRYLAAVFVVLPVFLSFIPLHGVAAESAASGKKIDARALYRHWCSQCHGLEGRGDGVNSTPDMSINPRDHTDASFMSTRSDEQFEDVIRGGGTRVAKSPLMPPWEATLTEGEIKALVRYMRELCKCEYEGVVSHDRLRSVDPGFR